LAHSVAPKLGPGLRGELVLQRAGYSCLDQLGRNEQAARTGDAARDPPTVEREADKMDPMPGGRRVAATSSL